MTFSFSHGKMKPLKALLILDIVFGHLMYYVDYPVFHLFHELGASCVAVFFFVSGYGLYKSWKRKRNQYLDDFFSSRVLRVLVPAICCFVLHIILCGTNGIDLCTIAKRTITQGITVPMHYWFVIAIVFFYLLFYTCFRWITQSFRITALYIGSFVFILLAIILHYDRCWWVCALAFPTGLTFSKYETIIRDSFGNNLKSILKGIMIGVLSFFVFYLPNNQYLWPFCYVSISWIVALLVSSIPLDKVRLPILNFIGTSSFEIYLTHITILNYLRGEQFYIRQDWLYLLLSLSITILLSFVLNRFFSIILPKH